ncbi:xanthine uracil permease [Rhizoctonia solani]|uniref:Xanthine uracil permease n=1 Tax=Rhizoctonia solani TaxID=456999 RepID=A0A8H7I440_9AGAM|nr:xanthine uracil permease [Rhizoctonia solani]
MSYVNEQPGATAPPSVDRFRGIKRYGKKFTTRDGWLGDYDFAWLCSPGLPWGKRKASRAPQFYALDADLPILLAMTCGFQHALAMLAGLITPPIIFSSALNLDGSTQAYMISASLIGCGILSLVQMSRLYIWRNYYLGTGLITVVGTSFATLSTGFSASNRISTPMEHVRPLRPRMEQSPEVLVQMLMGCYLDRRVRCSQLGRWLKRLPPPPGDGNIPTMSDYLRQTPSLPWGLPSLSVSDSYRSSQIVLVELFGSPFLKNASIIVGLLVGCIVAGAAGWVQIAEFAKQTSLMMNETSYMDSSAIDRAPAITFLWVKTFKIRVYPQLFYLCWQYMVPMEAIGDITASAEVSRVEVDGEVFDTRIQGGVFGADGIGGFVSALFTVTPLSIFAQNRCGRINRCIIRTSLFDSVFRLPLLAVPTEQPDDGVADSDLFRDHWQNFRCFSKHS